MARPAAPHDTLVARVRRFYGLRQYELAYALGISPARANALEAGRCAPSRAVAARLAPWLAGLPPAADAADWAAQQADQAGPPPAPPAGFCDAAPLEARRAACLHEARQLRWQLRELPAQARLAARVAQAQPAVLAALGPPPPEGELTLDAICQRYAHGWLALAPPALPPDVLTRWHLLYQRALALEAEAAALAGVLAEAVPPGCLETR